MVKKTYKYHYFYIIRNNINNKFYYGIHSTNELNDGYMGSDTRLHLAYNKYGVENFSKEILKFFDTREGASDYEKEMIKEDMLKSDECYNMRYGGDNGGIIGKVAVRDYEGNTLSVFLDDDRYISGEVVPVWSGRHHKKESKNKTRQKMTPKNSKNPRVWVCKDGKVKYLKKELLESYINDGWELGRTGYKPRKGCQGKIIEF